VTRTGCHNGPVTNVALVDRLRAWVRPLLRSSSPLPPVSRRGQLFDVLLAVGLGLLALVAGEESDVSAERVEYAADPRQHERLMDLPVPPQMEDPYGRPFLPIDQQESGWIGLMFVLVVAPLILRRRFPLAVLWTVLAAAPLVSDFEAALRLSFFACVIAAFTAAVYSPYRVPALASLPVAALIYTQLREEAVPTVPDDAVPFLILVPIAIAAEGLRRWKRRADEGRERLAALEIEQAAALRRATEQERARIARELHDVVTHNVSVMVIQAGAARKVMDASPDNAREALLAVEAGGRAAMTELRHVMGLLTMDSDGADPAAASGLVPQPGLDRLDALAQRVRDTGIAVELVVTGQPQPLLPGVELAAYRVVQEALTNTVKHAAGASAKVSVEYGSDLLKVEITDTGGTSSAPAGAGDGHGLIGLRERLAVYGGVLQASRRLTGGYRVTASIPLEAP
jgi:signal transduction histidine kinase